MTYTVTTDRLQMQGEIIHGFLSRTYWSPGIRREVVDEAINNSLVAGVIDNATGRQVAFARAVTDYATFAWVCDVFVDEVHRGRGLAKLMLATLEAHPRLKTLRRWCLATRDAHSLYRQLGYQPVQPDNWMEKRSPVSAWSESSLPPSR